MELSHDQEIALLVLLFFCVLGMTRVFFWVGWLFLILPGEIHEKFWPRHARLVSIRRWRKYSWFRKARRDTLRKRRAAYEKQAAIRAARVSERRLA